MSSRPFLSAFTLPETLAVIAGVAVLACLAIPAISGGLMAANRAKCASNMRQIGTAILLHAAENGGALPVTSHTTGDSKIKIDGQWLNTLELSWVYQLSDYLDNVDEVRVCPADEKERRNKIREMNATSYLLNEVVFDSSGSVGGSGRLQGIPHPARTALMFISNRPVSRTWDHAHCAGWNTWAAVTADIAPDRHRAGARSAERTKGSANYLYADGHVANLPAADLRRIVESGINPGALP